ncbi:MAG: hypothetical protein JWQ43_3440 [Glaciihabitans sp.]|nr:hypothetical protein [Glaciihabitans sp.]
MSTTDNTGQLVQLGHYEITASVLSERGDDLDAFTNNFLLHPAFVENPSLNVPLKGWRVVYESSASNGVKAQQILAAPHPEVDGAWVMAFRISSEDGFATYRYDPDPMTPVLPKKERRQQLALKWPEAHGEQTPVEQLRITLVNTSNETWQPSHRDDFYVAGLVNARLDGNPVNGRGYYAYIAGTPEAIELVPGASLELPVDVEQQLFDRLEPGKYVVTAILISLDLSSGATVATKG